MTNKILYFAQKGAVVDVEKKSLLLTKNISYNMPEMVNGKYALPGGKVDFGEPLDEACVREIEEETGIVVFPSIPLHNYTWVYRKDSDTIQIVASARLCRYMSGEPSREKQEKGSKILEVVWIPLAEVDLAQIVENERPAVEYLLKNTDLLLKMLRE